MKGIVLAGGAGTRLYPATSVVCKQLLPVYDKPMVYYPLSTLMLAGIKEILVISTPESTPLLEKLLGDGSQLGMRLCYRVQTEPAGIAQAILIGEDFIKGDTVALVLGDNVYYGQGLSSLLQDSAGLTEGAIIFGYNVKDPERYGVVELAPDGTVASIEEKPAHPRSNFAVVGLYFYDNDVIGIVRQLRPSARGEYEITDVNKEYLRRGRLRARLLGRGFAWLDTGTPTSLADATSYVRAIEERQGLKIACIEEVAYRMGFITHGAFLKLVDRFQNSAYAEYLRQVSNELRA